MFRKHVLPEMLCGVVFCDSGKSPNKCTVELGYSFIKGNVLCRSRRL